LTITVKKTGDREGLERLHPGIVVDISIVLVLCIMEMPDKQFAVVVTPKASIITAGDDRST